MSLLDDLYARRAILIKEYDAINAEYTADKKGDALADIKKRSTDKFNEIEAVTQQINRETGAQSASGQLADQAATNSPKQYDANNLPVNQSSAIVGGQQSLTSVERDQLLKANKDVEASPVNGTPATGIVLNKAGRLNVEDAALVTAGAASKNITAAGSGLSSSDTESGKTAQSIPASALSNRLHNFTSYTYKITLFLLTKEDYKQINNNPDNFVPKTVLISSAGGLPVESDASTKASWHPDFQEDFYFDNLSLTTVVGLNSKSRASNAINIKFSIIEPYGMSLLDRLMSACQVTAQSQNYIDQPYLLQIDFISNTDETGTTGTAGNVIDRKRIAIRFIDFKIRPGSGGTTYQVNAIPYNHTGFFETAASTPSAINVTAKTVKEYFDSVDTAEALSTAPISFNDTSFTGAYNNYYKKAADAKRTQVPQYSLKFHIDKLIADSSIIEENPEVSTTPTNEKSSSAAVGTASGTNQLYKSKGIFAVGYGTSIIGIIDRIVGSSSYVKNQVKLKEEEAKAAAAQTPGVQSRTDTQQPTEKKSDVTKWYKVIPSVELGDYDYVTNMYSKVITYSIVPYSASNFRHPDIKKTRVTKNQVVRVYNYYYTGLNQDVIGLDITFDTTFFTAVSAFSSKVGQLKTTPEVFVPEGSTDLEPSDISTKNLPSQTVATGIDTATTGAGLDRGTRVNVASVTRSLYTAYPSGDMLSVKLRIVGDPSFIKQDDTLYRPSQESYSDYIKKGNAAASPPINSDGQVIFDSEEVYVQLLVNNVVDIDDQTGIVNKQVKLSNGTITNGSFSGIYRVLSVTSDISRGKFEQILDLVRVPDDMVDGLSNSGATVKSPPTNKLSDTGASGSQPPGLVGLQTYYDPLAAAASKDRPPTLGTPASVLAEQKALDLVASARAKKTAAEAARISSPSEETRKLAEQANAEYQAAYSALRNYGYG